VKSHIRSIHRTFRGPFVLLKTQRSGISNTFHNDMEKRNPYQSKSRRQRRFLLRCTSSLKGREGNMLGSAHACMTYGM
jgi:hypothetical protein